MVIPMNMSVYGDDLLCTIKGPRNTNLRVMNHSPSTEDVILAVILMEHAIIN